MAGVDKNNKNLIKELDRIKNSLEESDKRFHHLMDLYPDVIGVYCEGKVVYINDAALKMSGLKSKEELIGKPALDFIHPDFKKIVVERIKQIWEGKYLEPIQEKLRVLNGEVIDTEVIGIPLIYKGKPSIQVIINSLFNRIPQVPSPFAKGD